MQWVILRCYIATTHEKKYTWAIWGICIDNNTAIKAYNSNIDKLTNNDIYGKHEKYLMLGIHFIDKLYYDKEMNSKFHSILFIR